MHWRRGPIPSDVHSTPFTTTETEGDEGRPFVAEGTRGGKVVLSVDFESVVESEGRRVLPLPDSATMPLYFPCCESVSAFAGVSPCSPSPFPISCSSSSPYPGPMGEEALPHEMA